MVKAVNAWVRSAFVYIDFSVMSTITPLNFLFLDGFASSTSISSHIAKMKGSPGQTRPLMCINITSSWCAKMCQLVFFQILVCTWWHWVSRGQYLLVLGGTGSVLGYVKVHRILGDFQNWIRSGRVPKKLLASRRITGTYGAMIVALLQWWTE